MRSELDPRIVQARLDHLRHATLPTVDTQSRQPQDFATEVANRLEELRALCKLADYLGHARMPK